MKRILYSLWLAVGAIVCSSCADYLDVDRYFYDQVSVDSAFSKRVYTGRVAAQCIQYNALCW